jgi:hypothetical protein
MAALRRTRNPERRRREPATIADGILDTGDASLLDVVDNALTKGVVLSGDLTLALANVDLVYARLSLLLCAADKVLPGEPTDYLRRRRHRANRGARRR